MQNDVHFPTRQTIRGAVIAVFMAAYVAGSGYAHLVLHTDTVYAHFAYIPIVFAGMWWGRRALVVAAVLGATSLAFHIAGPGLRGLADDVLRVVFFFLVALSVGMLSERAAASAAALRASDEKYRLVLDRSLAGIFVYRDDRFVFANARLCELLGVPRQELLGRHIWDFVQPADRARVQDLAANRPTTDTGGLRYECRLAGAGGRALWAEIASSTLIYEGAPAVLVNVNDITDRKEAEDKRRELAELARRQEDQLIHSTRLAELGEMAAAVAHELNQPLTGIRNFARNAFYMLDQSAGTPEEVKENLRLISDQVDRAARIISQMRELTRRSERRMSRVNLNAIVREAVEFLAPQMRLSGVDVALDLAPVLPDVTGDGIRLEQVFLNLLTNARQAMESSGERRLVVRSRADPKDGAVFAEVSDTGSGFSPEVAKKLFAPFFSTKKSGQGTGLGLSISLSIVKDHGGTIEAVGEPGKGATFTVRLPVVGLPDSPVGEDD